MNKKPSHEAMLDVAALIKKHGLDTVLAILRDGADAVGDHHGGKMGRMYHTVSEALHEARTYAKAAMAADTGEIKMGIEDGIEVLADTQEEGE